MSLMTSLRALLGTKSTRSPKIRRGTRSRRPAGWNGSILGFESLEDRLTPDSGGAYLSISSGVVALNPDGNPTGGLPQIIPNIKIEPIFVEDPTNAVAGANVPTPMKPQLLPFLNTYATTGLLPALLTQYNVPPLTFGNGSVGATDIVSQAPDTSAGGVPCYSDALIQQIIQNEINAGRTGASDGLDEYYVVFTPAGEGVAIDSAPGDSSVVGAGGGFFAYHSSFTDSKTGKVDYYTPIPDETLGGPNANLAFLGASAFQSETQTISHELTEGSADAITPNGLIGWHSGNPTVEADGGGEISDQADNDGYFYDGYFLQNTWSNALLTDGQVLGTGTNNLLIDQLTPPAVTGVQPVQVATFTSGDTSLTASDFYAQVYDTVTDPSGDPSLNWSNISITGSNGHFIITATPLPDSVVVGGGDGPGGEYGTPFTQDGFTVAVSTSPFNLVSPSGNAPIAVLQHPYTISSSSPLNYDASSGSGVNNFSLSEVGANYELSDNGLVVFTQPISKTSGGINIYADPTVPGDSAADIDDSLSISGSLGQHVTFDGGPASLPKGSPGTLYNHTLPFVSGVTYTNSFTVSNFNAGGTGLVLGDISTNSGSGTVTVDGRPTGLGTATFTVTATDSQGDTITREYSLTSANVPTTISATLTATPNNLPTGGQVTLTFTLTGSAATPTGTVDFTVGGRDLGSAPVINGIATLQTAAFAQGTSIITGTYSGDSTYSSTTATTSVYFGVTGAITTVTGPSSSIVYGAAAPLSVTVTGVVNSTPGPTGTVFFSYVNASGTTVNLGSAPVVNGTATYSASPLDAGSDVITATYSGDSNYSGGSSGSVTVIVTPVAITVEANPVSFVYGGVTSLPTFSYSIISPSTLPFTDTPSTVLSGTLSTNALTTSGVGAYSIVQGSLVADPNYTLAFIPAILTITPATLTVSIDSETKAYGAPLPTLAVGGVQGLVNGDTASSVLIGLPLTTATSASSVGTYPITLGTLDAGSNYTLVVNNTNPTLTITPVTLDVIANNTSTVYGSAFPTNLTYTTEGLANGDTAQTVLTGALATPVVSTNGVGKYPITQGTLALASNNYTLTFTPGTFSITRAKLIVTANSLTTENDGAIPPLTYTVTGLVNADLPGVVSGVVLSTTATDFSAPGQYPIMISGGTATNYTLTLVGGTLTVGLSTRLVGTSVTLVGSNNGTGTATLYNSAGVAVQTFTPFPGFTGSIRTAVGDFNGDGTPDLVFGTGPGILAQFVVLDGKTFQPLLFDTIPFQGFSGGLFVATGDIDGDGTDQVVVTPDQGGGPRVEIYHAGIGTPVLDFYGINDPNFRGGARAAIGDFTHDGHADLVVAAGAGGGARVVVYKGTDLSQGRVVDLVGDFFAFPNIIRNGVYVAVGDVNGDGYDDLIIGAGPGGGPNVLVLNGETLVDQGAVAALAHPIANFFAGDTTNRDGVPVSTENLTGDGYADVVTGQGGGGSLVTVYSGKALAAGNVDILSTLDPFGGSTGGVYVG